MLSPYCQTCRELGFYLNGSRPDFHPFQHVEEVLFFFFFKAGYQGENQVKKGCNLCAIKHGCRIRVHSWSWQQRRFYVWRCAFVLLFWSFRDALPVDGDKKSVSSHFVLISLYCSSAEIKAVQGRRRVILDEIHYISRECLSLILASD